MVRGDGRGSATLIECGVFRTSPRDALAERLVCIFDGVTELIARHKPDALAVESIFYARNVRTTVTLGHARGVLLLAGARAGVTIHEYPPAEIKKAITGTGGATKEQVQYMVKTLLRLKTVPSPNDAADGVAAALTCLLAARTSAMLVQAGRAR